MSKVLVVDDSAFMRKIIVQMIQSDPEFEVVGIARNGQDAIDQAQKLKPDIITLDIEMPVMDGLTALRRIKAVCHAFNPHVLMCSSLTMDSSNEALKALRIGASDVIGKDPAIVGKGDDGFKAELLAKLKVLSQATHTPHTTHAKSKQPAGAAPTSRAPASTQDFAIDPSGFDAVVIGSSTGGPPILEKILAKVTNKLSVPIIIAQHMPELFTRSLTTRLGNICSCGATLAEKGVLIHKPSVYIALGGYHIKLTRVAGNKVVSRLIEEQPGALYKPSVDLLFESASALYGSRLLAIQLTGMGEDGTAGAKAIRKAGGTVIAQEASSCVVYGMPKAVIEAGAASAILTPAQIQGVLSAFCGGSSVSTGDSEQIPPRMSA